MAERIVSRSRDRIRFSVDRVRLRATGVRVDANAATTFSDQNIPKKCYLCSRSKVLPMIPVVRLNERAGARPVQRETVSKL